MNQYERLVARMEKRSKTNSLIEKKKIRNEIKALEHIAILFHACGNLTKIQTEQLKKKL